MFNKFVLLIFALAPDGSFDVNQPVKQVVFPYRAECDYAAQKIGAEIKGAKALCFDVVVAGDRHESSYTQD